jgi:hypothetical protein
MSVSSVCSLFEKLFTREGFELVTTARGRGFMGWKGYSYPGVHLEYLPDPYGRNNRETWMRVNLELERPEGCIIEEFGEKVLVQRKMTSVDQALEIVEELTGLARLGEVHRWRVQPGVQVEDENGVVRKIKGIRPSKRGYEQWSPILLEGVERSYAYAEMKFHVHPDSITRKKFSDGTQVTYSKGEKHITLHHIEVPDKVDDIFSAVCAVERSVYAYAEKNGLVVFKDSGYDD